MIHAASHFDHKKRVAWVPISMHTCGSFFYNYGAPLGDPSGRRSSAIMPIDPLNKWRLNRPRSIYQYSNMGPRLSGLTSIFGVVFFVSKSPVGIERQKKLEKFAILTRKPRSHA